jgi:hypothetical protein
MAYADYDARDYVAAPPGTDLLLWYYRLGSSHDYYSHGSRASNDIDINSNIGILRYVHYFGIGPLTAYAQVLQPFGSVSMDGSGVGNVHTQTSGLGDTIPAAGIFLINNPNSKTYLGFTEYISAPTGNYQNDKALNIGTNRWGFKSELGFSKGFGFGDKWIGKGWNIDLGGAVEFYTDNTDYSSQHSTLSQDPLYTIEAHLSKDISKSLFAAVEYFFHQGAETSVNGVDNDDEVKNHQLQLTTGLNFAPGYQLLVQYKTTLKEENGAKTDTFGVRLMYAW